MTVNGHEIKLKTTNYSLFYGDFQALRDVSIEIPKNHITSIIGPSGCGKSTFLRSFNRMNDLIPSVSTCGLVTMDGANIFNFSIKRVPPLVCKIKRC